MNTIFGGVSQLVALHNMSNASRSLNDSLLKMSTGLRINKGADDPAGLIASEFMRGQKAELNESLNNVTRADNMIGTADAALTEISSLLTTVKGLVEKSASSAGLSAEEIQANQLQIDQAVASIDRISNSASFNGKKLLDGSMAFVTSGVSSVLNDVRVYQANISGGAQQVTVEVTGSAAHAQLANTASGIGATAVTLEVAGNKGVAVFEFAASATNSEIITAVNSKTDQTGVSAALSGAAIVYNSTEYGSTQFVSVEAIEGTYSVAGGTTIDFGDDATVSVNGNTAAADGLTVNYLGGGMELEFDLSENMGLSNSSTTFNVTQGGATFSLAGELLSIGIQSVNPARLGDATDGYLASLTTGGDNQLVGADAEQAATAGRVIDKAILQLARYRGRLGSFQSMTLRPTANSISEQLAQVTDAESNIRNLDYAEEVGNYMRSQVLSQAATMALSMSNSSASNVLSILQTAF